MVRLSHIALFAVLLSVSGILVAAILLDRWYLTTEDSLTKLHGLRAICERNDCTDYDFDTNGQLPCPYLASKFKSFHFASYYLFFIGLGLAVLAAVGALCTSCVATEPTRILIFGLLLTLVLLSALCCAASGGLYYFLVRHFLFCGDYCDYAKVLNSSIQCYAGFGTSFALWGIATILLFGTALFGSFLRLADKAALLAAADPDDPEGKLKSANDKPVNSGGDTQQKNPTGTDAGEEEAANDCGAAADIPAGYEWDEASGLYFSEEDNLWYDGPSGHYYDAESGQWYDPEKDSWYTA